MPAQATNVRVVGEIPVVIQIDEAVGDGGNEGEQR